MPKKKIIIHDEPVPARPHRNMKAKVVFDPSDNHIPKKRAKYSYKNEKPTEATTVKKTTKDRRRKRDTSKSKSLPVNPVTELADCSLTEINSISPVHSPINSPVKTVKSATAEVIQNLSKMCYMCSKISENKELLDCPICSIKAHKDCLIVDEPVWKFKLDLSPWLCKQCRRLNCSKCLEDKKQKKVMYHCVSCDVGLHSICYESNEIKPLHKVEPDMYVCIPCMTLATQINQEEVEEVFEIKDDVESNISRPSSVMSISSDEDDTGSRSSSSDSSTDYDKYEDFHNTEIPNVSKWNKEQIFEYLSERLPQEIVDHLIHFDIDGRSIQLLQRSDIVSNMGLKLGHALKFYKQVRILQSQSTYDRLFWE
ncbi:uncharacterized protein LOC113561247 [Rhopalosiphum maidis]|uniref:uncharacterized protein LOC113561247 n=1 Tax=Rhopalosiphum maidis TaxID=43146 RepID=UPI000EFE16BF|nr:uncharacterized protein LOC113561247 [Rhopalosiphum maidis]XP_026823359.1 uncharacterized protein LOC113561247 [Rhopalosiphum maidis]